MGMTQWYCPTLYVWETYMLPINLTIRLAQSRSVRNVTLSLYYECVTLF